MGDEYLYTYEDHAAHHVRSGGGRLERWQSDRVIKRSESMAEETKRCVACDGRGYHLCECWPGDCICGFGDETCEECMGEGFIFPDESFDPSEVQ